MTKNKKDQPSKEENNQSNHEEKKEPINNSEGNEEAPSIMISYDELENLQKQIVELQSQSTEYLNGLQRERADFANYKRRVDQENQNIYQKALADLVKPFLIVIDDLERALKHKPSDQVILAWVDGLELILQKLIKSIEGQGIERLKIEPGDPFDPMLYEAITHEDNPEFENGEIIEVVQTGYKIKDRIIRPALVRVAK